MTLPKDKVPRPLLCKFPQNIIDKENLQGPLYFCQRVKFLFLSMLRDAQLNTHQCLHIVTTLSHSLIHNFITSRSKEELFFFFQLRFFLMVCRFKIWTANSSLHICYVKCKSIRELTYLFVVSRQPVLELDSFLF